LEESNEVFQQKIEQMESNSGWDIDGERLLKEIQRMQESIDKVKQENETLRDERQMFHSQLITLKNVNESQQKLIKFLNESNETKDMSHSPSFYQKMDREIMNKS
jgi:RNA polymerase-interacting CarD/CdnL/TRCF family regulator